jgi:hypothetical protein
MANNQVIRKDSHGSIVSEHSQEFFGSEDDDGD